ncbi:unnamed protein product [Rhodiola kirilowii]
MKTLMRIHSSNANSEESGSASLLPSSPSSSPWVQFRSVLFVVSSASPANSCASSDRGRVKSPWSRRKRKHALSPQHWKSLFTPDEKLRDGGVKLLKRVRAGGVDFRIRAEVWPFLLGVYKLDSTKEERDTIRHNKRKEYERLRRKCRKLWRQSNVEPVEIKNCETSNVENGSVAVQQTDFSDSDDVASARDFLSSEEGSSDVNEASTDSRHIVLDTDNYSSQKILDRDASAVNADSSCSDSSVESVVHDSSSLFVVDKDEWGPALLSRESSVSSKTVTRFTFDPTEDFSTWQRIIRVDAVRANWEFLEYTSSQSIVSEYKARRSAEAVGLKDYSHLEPSMVLHAARLVAILEAYALYDPEIGYCQGMSDLLSPIITVIPSDYEAFWCFVAFMRKARNNFRLDEVGIRRQLNTVSKIIKCKDSHLFKHLQKLRAEDCFFVYRMVVVLFRRELSFEQTLCLWEVMWADQAAVRAGIGKSAWSKLRQRVPPTEDLLLYAVAASVLQKRKLIIEKYNTMDDIIRECNSMTGHLDVWKLLDDAHNLVMALHEKIETSP